jgi:hypothetical protein
MSELLGVNVEIGGTKEGKETKVAELSCGRDISSRTYGPEARESLSCPKIAANQHLP